MKFAKITGFEWCKSLLVCVCACMSGSQHVSVLELRSSDLLFFFFISVWAIKLTYDSGAYTEIHASGLFTASMVKKIATFYSIFVCRAPCGFGEDVQTVRF